MNGREQACVTTISNACDENKVVDVPLPNNSKIISFSAGPNYILFINGMKIIILTNQKEINYGVQRMHFLLKRNTSMKPIHMTFSNTPAVNHGEQKD
jgi:hypothetical protein